MKTAVNGDFPMREDEFKTYDFLINDEDEAMLLLYARDGEPKDPSIEIDPEDGTAVLTRNPEDNVRLEDIPDEVLDSLQEADKLLVCELSLDDDEKDTQIVYAYEAEITD